QDAMRERLGVALARYDAGDVTSEMNVISSGLHSLRSVFDLMPVVGEPAAAAIATRLAGVPRALTQLRWTLLEAADHGHVSPQAQLAEVAHQCDAWTDRARDNFWPALAHRV